MNKLEFSYTTTTSPTQAIVFLTTAVIQAIGFAASYYIRDDAHGAICVIVIIVASAIQLVASSAKNKIYVRIYDGKKRYFAHVSERSCYVFSRTIMHTSGVSPLYLHITSDDGIIDAITPIELQLCDNEKQYALPASVVAFTKKSKQQRKAFIEAVDDFNDDIINFTRDYR
jgi:hypothetical protein